MSNPLTVFISCGQFTDEEKQLGAEICGLVEKLTPFKPYFAEYQTSLEGLTRNILGALNDAVGLIAVLHPRGTVMHPTGDKHVRGSVWVEQEIAIAAFLSQIVGRKLQTAAFVHESVAREGMRDQLLLNPRSFLRSDEVISHLEQALPGWSAQVTKTSQVEINIAHKNLKITKDRHDYQLEVTLVNNGDEAIEQYSLEITFPTPFLEQGVLNALEVRERRSATHSFFRATHDTLRRVLFPGDRVLAFTLDYFVNHELFWARNGHFSEVVGATFRVPGRPSIKAELGMQELQKF